MSSPTESAALLLKLYELRRDQSLRAARDWFVRDFHPTCLADILDVLRSEENARFRMVAGYWDFACSLVTHGAIDWQMFVDANPEAIPAFAKLEPLLGELRSRVGPPFFARHWEAVIMRIPDAPELLRQFREGLRPAADDTDG